MVGGSGVGLWARMWVVMGGGIAIISGVNFRVEPTGIFMARVTGFGSSVGLVTNRGAVGKGDVVGVVTTYVGCNARLAIRYDNPSRGRVLRGTISLVRGKVS